MAEARNLEWDNMGDLLDQEDEETLAAIDAGIQDANEGRVVSSEEALRRMQVWLSRSSTPKKP